MTGERITDPETGQTVINDLSNPFWWEAVKRHFKPRPYVPGSISVTQLISPAYKRRLEIEHASEIVVLASSMLAAVQGTLDHAFIEQYAPKGYSTEVYMTADLEGGEILTGTADFMAPSLGILGDHKTLSVWEILNGVKEDTVAQMNVYAWMTFRAHGWHPHTLILSGRCKDWSPSKAGDGKYPETQDVWLEAPVWGPERTEAFIMERIAAHTAESPEPCSRTERWCRDKPEQWAVCKRSKTTGKPLKRAIWLRDTPEAAAAKMAEQDDRDLMFIERRPPTEGPAVRCGRYCSVAGFCPMYQEESEDATR